MSKAVLISIRPKWCGKIASGEKTIEVRKNRPKLAPPFKCYIYCTREKHLAFMQNQTGTNLISCLDAETAIPVGGFVGNGKIIGEFVCDRIFPIDVYDNGCIKDWNFERMWQACLPYEGIAAYIGREKRGYGWHISDLVIYDMPKALDSFWAERICTRGRDTFGCEGCWDCEKRPPQSWCYVEEQK